MTRIPQVALIGSVLAFSWLGMMAVHEGGHVLHAWLSGARVERVVLHPLRLSDTILRENPHPRFERWGGPIWGSLIPLVLLGLVRATTRPYTYLAAFFAGFCLVANGAYLGAGALYGGRLDDAAILLHHGESPWTLLAFALASIAAGLYLFHGLGPSFGFGQSGGKVDRKAALAAVLALGLLVAIELLLA